VLVASSVLYSHIAPKNPSNRSHGAIGVASLRDHQDLARGTYTIQTRETNPVVLGTARITRGNAFTYIPANTDVDRIEGTIFYNTTNDAYLFTSHDGNELFRVLATEGREHEVVLPTPPPHNKTFYLER